MPEKILRDDIEKLRKEIENLSADEDASKEKLWSLDDGDPMPGKIVTFTLYSNFDAKTTALSETGDPTAIDVSLSQVSITLVEYGNVLTRSAKVKATSFLDLDQDIVGLIAWNASVSIDLIARAAWDAETGGTWNFYASGSAVASITPGKLLTWAFIRTMANKLERNNVPPPRTLRSGAQLHGAIIHPDTKQDLRGQTGSGSWRFPKEYADADELMTGEIGSFEGFRYQMTNHARVQISSGASVGGASADVYTSYFYGLEAIGKANGNVGSYVEDDGTNGEFTVVFSGPFDKLRRIRNIGWKSLAGYGAIRTNALYKYHHASAYQTNVAQDEG